MALGWPEALPVDLWLRAQALSSNDYSLVRSKKEAMVTYFMDIPRCRKPGHPQQGR